MPEKKLGNSESNEKFSANPEEAIELRPQGDAELERLITGHTEVQRRLTQADTNPEGLLDNTQLKSLKLSSEDEIEYRKIRSQLLEKSSGSVVKSFDSESMKEYVGNEKLDREFRENCEPLFEEYHRFCAATGTNPSIAEWFIIIDPGRFLLGSYNIGIDEFASKTATQSDVSKSEVIKKTGFLKKILRTLLNTRNKELGSGNDQIESENDKIYKREAALLNKLKEIFEIEYFQHTDNWKIFLKELGQYNDEFIDKLVSI